MKINNFFDNYKRILLFENSTKNEIELEKLNFKPKESLTKIQEKLNEIKLNSKNINEKNFKSIYKETFKLNADLRYYK